MGKINYTNLLDYLYKSKKQPIGSLQSTIVDLQESREFYWRFHLPNDHILLTIKEQFYYHESYANYLSFAKEYKLYSFLNNYRDLFDISELLPTIINFDANNSILIYKYSANYILLEDFYEKSNTFPELIAQKVAKIIAKLHCQTNQSQECHDFLNEDKLYFQMPYPAYLLDRFEIDSVSKFSAITLNLIAFYQRYDSLKSAVQELILNHRRCCLTHNNLQLNKILISKNILLENNDENNTLIKIIDWENCSWGDPAFDVGTILAGYLQIWLKSLTINPAINLEESLQLATIPLETLQPSIKVFLQSYLKEYPNILQDYPDFIQRVIQFSGLAIIYEIIARVQFHHVFDGTDICMFQVAKNLLCKPSQSFQSILGMTESEIMNY